MQDNGDREDFTDEAAMDIGLSGDEKPCPIATLGNSAVIVPGAARLIDVPFFDTATVSLDPQLEGLGHHHQAISASSI